MTDMTTARHVIATAVYLHDRNMLDHQESESVADQILSALLSAPLPVRLDLAKQLLPDDLFKDYAQFKAEARAKEQGK